MNKTLSFFLLVLTLWSGSVHALKLGAKDQLDFSLSSSVISNQVTGNEAGSILTSGLFTEHYLSTNFIKNFDTFYVRAQATAKYTDEPTLKGSDYFEFQKFLVEMGSGFTKVSAGDFYTTYSRYTMGQSARGAMANLNGFGFNVIPFFGRVVTARENAAFARYATGLRATRQLSRELEIGVNYVNAYDDQNSISNSSGLLEVLKNTLYGADFKWTLSREFKLEGEVAQAMFTNDTTGQQDQDLALFLRNITTYQGYRLFAEFERVGTKFNSLTGFAAPDKQLIKANLSKYFFNQVLKTYVYGEYYHNNLDGAAAATLATFSPQAGIDLYFNELGFNLSAKTTQRNDQAAIATTNTVYAADAFYKFSVVRLNGSYELADYQDQKNSDNNYKTNYIRGDIKVPFSFKTFWLNELTPGFAYSLNTEDVTYDDNGSMVPGQNLTTTMKFSLSSRLIDALRLGLILSLSNSTRSNAADTDRKDYNVTASYPLNKSQSLNLNGSYMFSDFSSAMASNNYTNQVGKLTFEAKF